MLNATVNVTYDKPLTDAEKLRFAEVLRQALHHATVMALCAQVRDAEPPEYEPEFIHSLKLNVVTTVTPSQRRNEYTTTRKSGFSTVFEHSCNACSRNFLSEHAAAFHDCTGKA